MLAHMSAALEARPRQENAHLLMGIAYGELGDHPAALEAYGEALTLNPYNRGTLEYLGEAYLELDRPDDAKATLDRLAEACRRLAHAAVDPLTTCGSGRSFPRPTRPTSRGSGARARSRRATATSAAGAWPRSGGRRSASRRRA